MSTDTYNVYRARVGDLVSVTVDGRAYEMTVWRIDPPGTAATSYAAGPHIAAWLGAGRYGVNFDASSVGRYNVQLLRPAQQP